MTPSPKLSGDICDTSPPACTQRTAQFRTSSPLLYTCPGSDTSHVDFCNKPKGVAKSPLQLLSTTLRLLPSDL